MKTLVISLVIVVVAAVALGVYSWKDHTTASLLETVESRASDMLGTRVDAESAEIQWDAGAMSVVKLEIANPGGFSDSNMISVESIEAQGDLKAGRVERLVFDGIEILIEFRGAGSNIELVSERAADNADEQTGSGREAGAGDDGESGEQDSESTADDEPMLPEEWRIETVSFGNVSVSVRADWTSDEVAFDADGLTLENLEGRVDDLTRDVMVGFLSEILDSGAEQVDDSRLQDSLSERAAALREKIRDEEADSETN